MPVSPIVHIVEIQNSSFVCVRREETLSPLSSYITRISLIPAFGCMGEDIQYFM